MPRFNKTYLSLDNAEKRGFIHRDYIAHCLRWTHAVKFLQQHKRYESANILDVGCGKELPFLKTLYTSRMSPVLYVGVDAGTIEPPKFLKDSRKTILEIYPKENFLEFEYVWDKQGEFTLITSFEVLEHMSKEDGIKFLNRLRAHMSEDTMLMISTPCFNGKAAANHVYEWGYNELEVELERFGMFKIKNVYGTFASIKDYENRLMDNMSKVMWDRLREYYDVNYLATLFAPCFSDLSRNCLWELSI